VEKILFRDESEIVLISRKKKLWKRFSVLTGIMLFLTLIFIFSMFTIYYTDKFFAQEGNKHNNVLVIAITLE
jgi:integral membrane sensor domain MASE1